MRSSVLEAEGGTGDDVLDRLGYEYLTAGGARHHARGEMHGDAAPGAGTLDDLAHMDARACSDADVFGRRQNPLRRPNGIDRSFERGHELVTGPVHEAAAVCVHGSVGGVAVGREHVGPAFIAELA